jgi:hypothetical protein
MNILSKCILAVAAFAGAATANAAVVTYTFTGIVTGLVGVPASSKMLVGDYVTGTYTFTYDAADNIIGFVGVVSPWAVGSSGIPYNPVFSYTAKINGSTFESSTSAPNGDPDDSSVVTGSVWTFTASEATPAFDEKSFFTIENITGVVPYSSDGFPTPLSGNHRANGGINIGTVFISYKVTSLSVAPAAAPGSLFTSLVGNVTGVGPGKLLGDTVELAEHYYSEGNISAACKALTEFLGEVQLEDGRLIPVNTAGNLRTEAQAIAATIGCVR